MSGLEKLLDTESQVSTMQEELFALQPQLQTASAETEELMKTIAAETIEADKVKLLLAGVVPLCAHRCAELYGRELLGRRAQLFSLGILHSAFLR